MSLISRAGRLATLALTFVVAASVSAQPATADAIPAAEAAFQNGLASYRSGDYAEAERLFSRAADEFGYNERTTAATLMAAKSAYAEADFDRAISAATRLISQYPTSRYAGQARSVLANATSGGVGGRGIPFDLGIVLPIAGENGYLGQALFNGVRIAVDEHNERSGRPVRMIFRDSRATGDGARLAVEGVVGQGADAIIGPLFSDEAVPAGAAAEAARVVLLAPLANTDEAISRGRRYVFQANPTFPSRGRAMARYATGRLGLRRLGVASQRGEFGADMAAGFAAEARRLGATVTFEKTLADASDWQDLDREIGTSTLASVDAVYLPVTGRDAPRYAADALRSLDALNRAPRPLGNTEWEGLSESTGRASRLGAVFTQDFFVAPGAADTFGRRYRQLSGIGQDRLSLIGYDLARFLLGRISEEGDLGDAMRQAERFDGIGNRYSFGGGQVNEALFILAFRDGQAVLLE